ncbi:tetratricopeptide repeat protein [Gilvibacter sediminis]|uniref:tetratricopeptide repeat protein n=1 Tax=Gilvibacter sediminis TaxID=379071 RepID=UPI00235031E7|nr:hypothetical protein [Gilvibacter sediminis]MDC7997603.1 hypothetical protein [Gilvibacter sediminis]
MRKTALFLLFIFSATLTYAQASLTEAKKLIEQKNYAQSERILYNYLQSDPNNLEAQELYGDALGYQEKWDESIVVYEKLALAKPKHAEYHYKYGGAMGMKALSVSKFKALGMLGDIKSAFLTAAELDPKHIEVRWALVEFFMQLPGIVGGSERKAQKYANELLALSPVDGWLAKGYIAEYNEDFKDAESAYKKAIEVGGSELTYNKLIDLYEAHGEGEKAIETTRACLAAHDNNRLHYQIGKIAATYNINPELGINCLVKYIENYTVKDGVPKDWAYYRLAQIYRNLGDKGQAQTWIDKALASRPDFKEAKKEAVAIGQMSCC